MCPAHGHLEAPRWHFETKTPFRTRSRSGHVVGAPNVLALTAWLANPERRAVRMVRSGLFFLTIAIGCSSGTPPTRAAVAGTRPEVCAALSASPPSQASITTDAGTHVAADPALPTFEREPSMQMPRIGPA